MGHSYVAEVEQHSSQTDAAKGFGGKFGVQKDRLDKVRKLDGAGTGPINLFMQLMEK